MGAKPTRRRFIQTAAASGLALGLGDLSGFLHLIAAGGTEPRKREWEVRYRDDIEPLVRLIEETPAEKCIEVIAQELKGGLSYQRFMTALFLAGLRNGTDTGYYHCIYMIHSVNQLSLAAPIEEQLLALFAALDVFKGWQARHADRQDNFGLCAIPKSLPSVNQARAQLAEAFDSEDPDFAERVVIPLVRSEGRNRLFDLLAPHVYRGGGVHRWIQLSNSWRTLDVIGWQWAEPVFRGAARVLSQKLDWIETWYRPRREKASRDYGPLPAGWAMPKPNVGLTRDLVELIREGDTETALSLIMKGLIRETAKAGAVWDALHLMTAEAYLREPEGNSTHANTGLNALRFGFDLCGDDETRLMIMIRALADLCGAYWVQRAKEKPVKITDLTPQNIPDKAEDAANAILLDAKTQQEAAVKAFAFALRFPQSEAFWQLYRRLYCRKGDDPHDFKRLAAMWENADVVSPEWRPYLLAASVYGPETRPDSPVYLEAREVLRNR